MVYLGTDENDDEYAPWYLTHLHLKHVDAPVPHIAFLWLFFILFILVSLLASAILKLFAYPVYRCRQYFAGAC